MNAWLAQDKPGGEAFSFQAGGATWWASLQPVSDAAYSASAGLAVSQEALLSLILADNRAPLLLGGGVILVLVLLVLLGVQLRRRGRAAPGPFFDTEADVLKLLAEGESERLEFKSSLRLNLASGKFGKEIELACMKTLAAYMNTDGGILAVGVDDQGQVLGLQPDGFENDDHLLRHFCALFAQHIGTEFMRLVRFALRSVGDAQVLLIECSPSEEPVFLKGTKEEEFYVRAGPSSRRLSISEFHRRVLRKEGPR
nr:ATP-binding protein [Fundidesulfovibrio soli]